VSTDKPLEGYDPDPEVARYFGIHPKSLPRWDKNPKLEFPKPIYINGRKYRNRAEIREFERRAAASLAGKTTT
jgi:hypothetical protein